MTDDQASLLELRFAETQTEWRRLRGDTELRKFLAEAKRLESADGRAPTSTEAEDPPGADGRAFTLADALIAETGTLVLTGRHPGARRAAFLAEEHYALVAEEAVYDTLVEFLEAHIGSWQGDLGGQITLITGPSRTADIEKILVLGAHGPRRLVIGSAPRGLIDARFAASGEGEASP